MKFNSFIICLFLIVAVNCDRKKSSSEPKNELQETTSEKPLKEEDPSKEVKEMDKAHAKVFKADQSLNHRKPLVIKLLFEPSPDEFMEQMENEKGESEKSEKDEKDGKEEKDEKDKLKNSEKIGVNSLEIDNNTIEKIRNQRRKEELEKEIVHFITGDYDEVTQDDLNLDRSKMNEEELEIQNIYETNAAALSKATRKDNVRFQINALRDLASGGHVPSQNKLLTAYIYGERPFILKNFLADIEEYAAVGNQMANMFKGYLYAVGLGVKANQAKSLVYYSMAAFSGNTFAQMAMGYRWLHGVNTKLSCRTSLEYYKRVANRVKQSVNLAGGNVVQRIRLLDELENPVSFSSKNNDLIQYYQYLADKGDLAAQVALGQLYFQGGRGVQQDHAKALHYLMLAAEADNANAMAFLGKMYLTGSDAVKKDYSVALKYFQMAAEKDNPIGQSGLGTMYLYGYGVKQDFARAHKNFNLASLQGWVDGQLHLGIMYLRGYGVAREYKTAIKYFTLASQAGHVLGFYYLAKMHALGLGTIPVCHMSVDMFKNVAERGKWARIMMDAYQDYQEGRVLESFFKYSFLAEMGYEVAQSNAAFLLDRGELSETNLFDQRGTHLRAFKYWDRSATQGYSVARVKLGDYHYYGQGTPVNYKLAAAEYQYAGEKQHNAQGYFNLAYMHEQGLGLKRDLHLAKRFYDLSAKLSIDAAAPVAISRLKLHWYHFVDFMNGEQMDRILKSIGWEKGVNEEWEMLIICILSATLVFLVAMRIFSLHNFLL